MNQPQSSRYTDTDILAEVRTFKKKKKKVIKCGC